MRRRRYPSDRSAQCRGRRVLRGGHSATTTACSRPATIRVSAMRTAASRRRTATGLREAPKLHGSRDFADIGAIWCAAFLLPPSSHVHSLSGVVAPARLYSCSPLTACSLNESTAMCVTR
jgi:hypothetical protein